MDKKQAYTDDKWTEIQPSYALLHSLHSAE